MNPTKRMFSLGLVGLLLQFGCGFICLPLCLNKRHRLFGVNVRNLFVIPPPLCGPGCTECGGGNGCGHQ